jgi:hypothetical protein
MNHTITINFAQDLFALRICSFIDGVPRDTTVLIQASLAAREIGRTTFFASSHSCTKNKSIESLFFICTPFSLNKEMIYSIFV